MKTLIMALWLAGLVARAQEAPLSTAFHPVFTSQTELGVLLGRVVYGQPTEYTENRASLTLQTFNGVQLTQRLALGGVVGADWYGGGALLMPLGGGVRYELGRNAQKGVRVYSGLDAGYSTTWLMSNLNGDRTSGGLFVSPSIGLRMGRPDRSNFTLSFSYRHQEASVIYAINSYWLRRTEERVYNRFAMRMGVAF
jgi:hypothetical protein